MTNIYRCTHITMTALFVGHNINKSAYAIWPKYLYYKQTFFVQDLEWKNIF